MKNDLEARAREIVSDHVKAHRRDGNQGEFPAGYFADELAETILAFAQSIRAEATQAANEAAITRMWSVYADIAARNGSGIHGAFKEADAAIRAMTAPVCRSVP